MSENGRDGVDAPLFQEDKGVAAQKQRGGTRRSAKGQRSDPGRDLERRTARIEFAEGALTRVRVAVRSDVGDAGRDVLTDIDVLSLDVDSRLRISRSCLECKSTSGQAGEVDRLFWLAGLRSYLRFERGVLVREVVSARGRSVGARLNVSLLDGATLQRRERANSWVPERFAHIEGDGCNRAEAVTDAQVKELGHVPAALVTFLRSEAMTADPIEILLAIERLAVAWEEQGALPEPASVVIASHALMALVLAALQDASALDELSVAALRVRLAKRLTVGLDGDRILELLSRADDIFQYFSENIHRDYVSAGATRVDRAVPSVRQVVATPPEYLDSYLDLVQRFREHPQVSRDIAQTVELACFDGLMGDSAWEAPAFHHLFTPEHGALVGVCLRTLGAVAGPAVEDALAALRSLRFNRTAPRVPERLGDPPVPERRGEPPQQ